MRVAVIINPVAGAAGRPACGGRRADLARSVLAREGVEGDVHLTARVGHAVELARAARDRGAALVVAWGGDGTVNEVGRALVGGPVALGIVRAGSGNGLARELRIPAEPAAALRAALRTPERVIDAGELGGRLFLNVAGIGVDAQVAARFAARGRGRRGLLPYLVLALRALLTARAADYTLRADGETLRRRALLVAFANSRQYGGGAVVAPSARLDDGLLDLVVVEGRPALARLWQARRLLTGTLPRAPGVTVRRFREVEVSSTGAMSFHVDGEPVAGGLTLAARVLPAALRVRAG